MSSLSASKPAFPSTAPCGWSSSLFPFWVRAWFDRMRKRHARVEDLPPLPTDHLVEPMLAEWDRRWISGASILRVLLAMFKKQIALRAWFRLLAHCMPILSAPLLKWMIEAMQEGRQGMALIVLGVALIPFLNSVVIANLAAYFETNVIRRITGLVGTVVVRKTLRLHPSQESRYSRGELVSLAEREPARAAFVCFLPDLVLGPLAALAAAGWLIHLLGWAFLPALAVIAAYVPLRTKILARMGVLLDDIWQVNRERLSTLSETLLSIEAIKLHALERVFGNRIAAIRNRQAGHVVRMANFRVASRVLDFLLSAAMATLCIPVYALSTPVVQVAVLFSALAAFEALADIMGWLPDVLDSWMDSRQAGRRLDTLLTAPEAEDGDADLPIGTIRLAEARPAERPGSFSLDVAPGQLVCVVGAVGSGKSTLLGLVAGQVGVASGVRRVSGRIAWCPSRPWILSGTLAANISTEREVPQERLERALAAVALDEDLRNWHEGLATEIGERGINLSGGQKARLALARAAVTDAEVVILDDSYSALDPGVAAHVHRELVLGLLADRTRLVSTHRLEFAVDADVVIVLEHGRIVEAGHPRELLARLDSCFARLFRHAAERRSESAGIGIADAPSREKSRDDEGSAQSADLTSDEDVHVSGTDWAMAWRYLKMMAPGAMLAVFLLLVVSRRATSVAGEGWLAWWGTHGALPVMVGIAVYALLQVGFMLMEQAQFSINLRGGVRAVTSMHDRMARSILASPKAFFDVTPSGRILNRFSSDHDDLEGQLPLSTGAVFRMSITVMFSLGTLALARPAALVFLPVPILAAVWAYRQVRRPMVRLTQLRAMSRSLTLSRITETIDGAAVVRAAGLGDAFLKTYVKRTQAWMRAMHCAFLTSTWNRTVGFTGGSIFAALGVILTGLGDSGAVPLAISVVALNRVLSISGHFTNLTSQLTRVEQSLASFKRVEEYSDLPSELETGSAAPEAWPRRGEITVEELEVRYRPELAPVLRSANLRIGAGEKVGIVGRTGAGKSTLFLALTRMLEPTAGTIRIDGISTRDLRVEELRRAFSIIPQEPAVFAASVRFNLDPEGRHGDATLERCLRRAHLWDRICSLPEGLATRLGGEGVNLSSGERQLLCFARAILQESRIILMDEATSGIDTLTDARLQLTIRENFAHATLLVIAHRPETLRECNRIVEVVDGRIEERRKGGEEMELGLLDHPGRHAGVAACAAL